MIDNDDDDIPPMVIPNLTPTFLIAFGLDGEPYARYPVIAWRINHASYAVPIICEYVAEPWCLELPDAAAPEFTSTIYLFPDDCGFLTMHEAKERAREINALAKAEREANREALKQKQQKRATP